MGPTVDTQIHSVRESINTSRVRLFLLFGKIKKEAKKKKRNRNNSAINITIRNKIGDNYPAERDKKPIKCEPKATVRKELWG